MGSPDAVGSGSGKPQPGRPVGLGHGQPGQQLVGLPQQRRRRRSDANQRFDGEDAAVGADDLHDKGPTHRDPAAVAKVRRTDDRGCRHRGGRAATRPPRQGHHDLLPGHAWIGPWPRSSVANEKLAACRVRRPPSLVVRPCQPPGSRNRTPPPVRWAGLPDEAAGTVDQGIAGGSDGTSVRGQSGSCRWALTPSL
jgi:hypothetical protein